MMNELNFLLASLELKQLFVVQAAIERQIAIMIKLQEIPEMEVAMLKHKAINQPSIIMSWETKAKN